MNIPEKIAVILMICLVIMLTVSATKLVYQRFLKSFREEVKEYLSQRDQEFIASDSPQPLDWSEAPFKKPSVIKFNFLIIQISGMYIRYSDKKYRIITSRTKSGKEKRTWLEIETMLFIKPKLKYIQV